jgi:hypothetical protein
MAFVCPILLQSTCEMLATPFRGVDPGQGCFVPGCSHGDYVRGDLRRERTKLLDLTWGGPPRGAADAGSRLRLPKTSDMTAQRNAAKDIEARVL